jgi:Xaa-Pro aminopeptidase
VQYFTNWPPLVENYAVFFPSDEGTVLVRLWNHLPDAKRISVVPDVQYGGDTPDEQALNVARLLDARGCKRGRIGLIGPIRHADMLIVQRELPGATFEDLNPVYRQLRLVKSDEELVFTRLAARMADDAVAAMERGIHVGMREFEIAKIIEDTYLAERGVNLIHFTLSTSMDAPDVCVPHQYHPDRVIKSGDVIVTEISTTFWGYAGQILRSFVVDAEPTELYHSLYDVAMETYDSIVSVLRAGVTIGEILDRANAVNEAGFSIWDDLVHGFGGAYIPPILRTRQTRGATHPDGFAYEAGTVLVVQPNVINEDATAGVQVGNAMVLTENGTEILQKYPTRFVRCG